MANTIKHKRGSGSDPSASDLSVGELVIRTDTGVVFTKKDDGSVAEISGSSGAVDKISEGNTEAEVVDTGSDGHFKVTTEGTERLRIDSSGNLGLGSTSPDDLLHLSASNHGIGADFTLGKNILRFEDTDTSQANNQFTGGIVFEGNDSDSNAAGLQAAITCNAASSGGNGGSQLRFYTTAGGSTIDGSSSPSMLIDNAGRLGIGVAPSDFGSNRNSLEIHSASGTVTHLALTNSTTNSNGASNGFNIIQNGLNTLMYLRESGFMSFSTANTERMRIDSSGKVGIGCTPVRDLQLHTSDASSELMLSNSTTGASAGSGFMIQQDGNDNYIWNKENSFMSFGTNAAERMRIDSSGNTKFTGNLHSYENASGTIFQVVQPGVAYKDLTFRSNEFIVGTGSGSALERMRIDSSGNLKLRHTGKYMLTEGTTSAFSVSTNGANGHFLIRDEYNNSDRMIISNTGNVGIGTTSPTSQYGTNLNINHATSSALHLTTGNSGSSNTDGFHIINSSGIVYLWNREATDTVLATNNTERLRIDSSGRLLVGRNSTSHEHPLQVQAASGANAIAIAGRSVDDQSEITFYENDNTTVLAQIQQISDRTVIRHRAGYIRFDSGGVNEKMRLDSSGYLHIANTASSAHQNRLLQIGDTARNASYIEIRSSTTGDGGLLFSDGTAGNNSGYRGTVEYNHASDFMQFKTAATARMRIDSSGSVGIGLTNPGDYHANANSLVASSGITLANTTQGSIYFADSATGTGEYVGQLNYEHSSDSMQFVVGNSERAKLDSSGFDITGSVTATSFKFGDGTVQTTAAGGGPQVIAWANLNSSNSVLGSSGFSSITNVSSGIFTATFSSSLSNANYAVAGTVQQDDYIVSQPQSNAQGSSSFRYRLGSSGNHGNFNHSIMVVRG